MMLKTLVSIMDLDHWPVMMAKNIRADGLALHRLTSCAMIQEGMDST